ncbi:hypothetical protein K493DRAFT_334707 [Basidiobolus meristosporus CBS 931.73]|uniref:Galactose oxidase n=1 Tax=Basidiobolus meristosporus CBS 931.73 TaxID=1314790 RepID=A0A1Y1YW15_9FUNG|nr:hypothetical protein K493DRAFT_334707 [Basidiobolus meristosporus CBS 931.73]|eukprot:ORY02248.1 hypothetical protein K493DRAFT_334707 [Basidiobolus meristosporus CBS 931.73]
MKSLLNRLAVIATTLAAVQAQIDKEGQWDLIGHSGVSAMHMALTHTNHVIILDRVQKASKLYLPSGDFAWGSEYDLETNTVRPLDLKSNTFCSAGGFLSDGTLINVSGSQGRRKIKEGFNGIRSFKPCTNKLCDFNQDFNITLESKRWYPTVEGLADGRLIIIGGSTTTCAVNTEEINVPTFELYPQLPDDPFKGQKELNLLKETLPNNLYPAAHLLPNGNLFIFASTKSVILNTKTWEVERELPEIPGGVRTYPLTGASILLPLSSENKYQAEVLICGGSTKYNRNSPGITSCGRINLDDENPQWEMEEMPIPRVMPDMMALPDGKLIILNGVQVGTAGFNRASSPAFSPVIYDPKAPKGERFTTLRPSTIPRVYHSTAILIPDGRIFVAGSNPNTDATFEKVDYPTEYRIEAFSPPYLFGETPRPVINKVPEKITYGESFELDIGYFTENPEIKVVLIHTGFATHSTHMSHRHVTLEQVKIEGNKITVRAPLNANIAPPKHYMVFVLENNIPSIAKWVQVVNKI